MKRTNNIVWIVASSALALAAAGCGPERRQEPPSEPFDPNDPQVALGERVFSRHCYQCHPGGASGLGPAINDKPLPVFAIKTQVRAGAGLMPAFSGQEVSDEELEGVVKYLKALRTLRGVGA
jgi:mono/diheme cytochrome c family protein